MKASKILLLLIGSCLLFISTACQPTLKEFQPKKDSLFKLTFSYPSNWKWEQSPNTTNTYDAIDVFEPYPAGEGITETSRSASISVWLDSKHQDIIDSHLAGIEVADRLELRDDRELQIDGHPARWLTIINTWESTDPGITYIHEFIYLLMEDGYYTITLYIPESEVDGRFYQEFKAMVESIKFLP